MPAVSVIMPVLDGAKYIGSAIESVLGQSFRDWEVIVIDDGSVDRTPDIVRSYTSDMQLRSIRQENRGLAAARNRGLSEAGAALVAFLDADDLWLEDHLEAMVARMEEAPAAVLAFAGWQYVDEHGDLLPQFVIPFDGDPARARRELPWRNSVLPSAVLARTDAVRRVGGFDAALHACEDWDLWIRLLGEGPFVASPKVSTLYRAHAESMTENGHAIECERLRVNEKHHGLAVGSPVQWPEERRRAVGHTLFASALAELRRRDTAAGLNKLRQALEVWPGLANQDEFYFELACAYQARGVRGTSRDLDLEKGAQLMRLLPLPGGSWGRAYFALARVALVAGDRRAGRRYSRKAVRSSSLRWKGRALAMVATSMLPLEWSRSLSRWRQAWRATVFQGAGFSGK